MISNITYDDVDNILDCLDQIEDKIPESISVTSTKDLLKNQELIDKNFAEFAPYLLWISEKVKCSDEDDERKLGRMISDLFAEHTIAL